MNGADFAVAAVLVLVLAAAVFLLVRRKRSGNGCCSCGCSSCSSCASGGNCSRTGIRSDAGSGRKDVPQDPRAEKNGRT